VQNLQPDLFVITGDIVDPSKGSSFKALYENAMEFIKNSGIPWAWTGGSNVQGLTREQMLRIDQAYSYENSWSGYKWENADSSFTEEQTGWFTGRIPIMANNTEMLSVYLFDSEHWQCADGVNMPGHNCIGSDAISWYTEQQVAYSHHLSKRDILFMHRPIQEFMQLANNYDVYGTKQEAVGCQAINTGLFGAALTQKKTGWIATGGDPDNDFVAVYHNMHMSYGRKSGSGGPGNLPVGARVFELKMVPQSLIVSSWIVDAEGNKNPDAEVRVAASFSFTHQTQCGVDPLASMF
jgi:hypothetical protein